MDEQTRRGFLKTMTALGSAVALGPLESLAGEETTQTDMSIARWEALPIPEAQMRSVATKLTERAIDVLGGMRRFVRQGDTVWIKPNIGWNRAPELAAGTNPDVVATLARLCLDAGAKKVKVGDHTCHEAKLSYRTSGIEAAAKKVGADVLYLDPNRFRRVSLGGKKLRDWPIYPEIIESDLVINVPIAKHHGLCKATLAMKNLMGVVGGRRNTWHQDLSACLIDLTAFVKPRLNVLDAVRVLTNHGPQGGNPADVKLMGIVAAGTDIVALDAFGAELLGHDPTGVQTVRAAHAAGLGEIDYHGLALEELTVS